jgi:hypothetical protein
MLHLFASVSDRRDVALLWQHIMKTTAEVLPCDACRKHLTAYLKTHTFMKLKQPNLVTGAQVKEQITVELHTLHNVVNQRLGKSSFPFDDLKIAYTGPRAIKLVEAKVILEELKTMWFNQLFKTVMPGPFQEWKKGMNLLAALLT